jgi:hypothetical protein
MHDRAMLHRQPRKYDVNVSAVPLRRVAGLRLQCLAHLSQGITRHIHAFSYARVALFALRVYKQCDINSRRRPRWYKHYGNTRWCFPDTISKTGMYQTSSAHVKEVELLKLELGDKSYPYYPKALITVCRVQPTRI